MDKAELTHRVGEQILSAVDWTVEHQWPAAIERASKTSGSTEQRVAEVRAMFVRELSLVGAAGGASAAVPCIGTTAAVATAVAELGWFTKRIADLMLTIAAVHGHTEAAVEERRAWLLSVLAFGDTATAGLKRLAGELGKGLGAKATRKVPTEVLRAVNRSLGRTIITKYGTKRGAVALGRLLPFGFGAAFGGAANYAMVRVIARQADQFFRLLAPTDLSGAVDISARSAAQVPATTHLGATTLELPRARPTAPRSLKDTHELALRLERIDEPHVRALNDFVRDLRKERDERAVPWFDPDGAGVNARILFLAEAPGPQSTAQSGSGIISPDNDDQTAENTYRFRDAAGADPACLTHWNIVPWYVGDGSKIRGATVTDLADAAPSLERLLGLLPRVRVVMLVGSKAQLGWERHRPASAAGLPTVACPHPSATNVNTRPGTKDQIIEAFRAAVEIANSRDPETGRFVPMSLA